MAYDGSLKFDTKIDASGFQKGVNGLFGTVSGIAKGTAKVLGGAATAVMGIGTAAIKVGSDFESSMTNVEAISGATGEDLARLAEKAKEMGETTIFSAKESADAMTYMAMAGWKTEDMLNGISGIMDLAAASGEDLARTSDIVTDALTAFGMGADESGRFADVLAAASSNANTNVGLMGETFKYVAPVAGAMGYNVEDCATAIGLMANAGIKGSQAGTALRSLLSRMAKPTKEVAEAMDTLHVSLTDDEGRMKSMSELTGELREAFSGLSEAQQTQLAASLAGQEGMSGLLAIVNASEDDYIKLTDAINSSEGAAASMAETMNKSLTNQTKLLKSALEGLGLAIYEDLEAPAKSAVASLNGIVSAMTEAYKVNGFTGLVQEAGKAFVGLAKEAAKAVPEMVNAASEIVHSFLVAIKNQSGSLILAAADMVMSIANGLISNFGEITAVGINLVSRLIMVLSQRLPELAQTGATALQTIGNALVQNIPNLASTAITLVNSLASYVRENLPALIPVALDAILQFSQFLRSNVGSLVDAGLNLITSLADSLIQNLPALIEKVPLIITNLAGCINDNAPKILSCGIQLIGKLAGGLIAAIPTLVANIPQIIQAIVSVVMAFNWLDLGAKIVTFIGNGLKSFATSLPTIVHNGIRKIVEVVSSGIGALPGFFSQFVSNAGSIITNFGWGSLGRGIIEWIGGGISALISNIPSLLQTIGTNAIELVKGIDWIGLGTFLIEGIISGISGLASAAAEAILGVGKAILDGFKSFFGIASPSTVMEEQGNFLVEGIKSGLSNLAGAIGECLSGALDTVVQWGSDLVKNGVSAAGDFLSNVGEKIGQVPGKVGGFLGDAIGHVKQWGSDTVSKAKEAGSNFLSNVQSNFSQVPGKIGTQMTSALSKVTSWGTNTIAKAKECGSNVLSNVQSNFSQIPGKIGTQMTSALTKVTTWGTSTVAKIKSAATQTLSNIQSNFSKIPGKVGTQLTSALSKVTSWGTNVVSKAKSAANNVLNGVKAAFSKLPAGVQQHLTTAVNKVASWGTQLVAKGKAAAQSCANAVKGALNGLPSAIVSIGSNIAKGLASGISKGISWVTNAAKNLANKALNAAKSALGIHSPSKLFQTEVGKMIPPGISIGVDRAMPRLESDISEDMSRLMQRAHAAVAMETGGAAMKARAMTGSLGDRGDTEGRGDTTYNQTFNINQPVKTPSEVARAVRLEQQFGLAGE